MYHICIGGLEENGCLRSCSELLGAAQPAECPAQVSRSVLQRGGGRGRGEGGGVLITKGPFYYQLHLAGCQVELSVTSVCGGRGYNLYIK